MCTINYLQSHAPNTVRLKRSERIKDSGIENRVVSVMRNEHLYISFSKEKRLKILR